MDDKKKLRAKRRRRNKILILLVEALIIIVMSAAFLVVAQIASDGTFAKSVPVVGSILERLVPGDGGPGRTEGANSNAGQDTSGDNTGAVDLTIDNNGYATNDPSEGNSEDESGEPTSVEEGQKDSCVYEAEGVWIVFREPGAGIDEPGRLMFSSYEDYLYTQSFEKDKKYEAQIYNYTGADIKITVVMNEESSIEGVVEAGEISHISMGTLNADSLQLAAVYWSEEECLTSYVAAKDGLMATYEAVCAHLKSEYMNPEMQALNADLPVTGEGSLAVAPSSKEQELTPSDETISDLVLHMSGDFEDYQDSLGYFPYCTQLIWKRSAPDAAKVAAYANISLYNGESMEQQLLGGAGKGYVLAATILAAQNGGLPADVTFSVIGNTMQAVVPFSVSEGIYKNLRIGVACENGTIEYFGEGVHADGTFDMTNDTYCKITDPDGGKRTYKLETARLKHNIPVIYINTDNGAPIASEYEYVHGSFSMDAEHVKGVDSVATQGVSLRGRGHSTWLRWPKKSYKLKFDSAASLFGLEKDKDWVMLSNYYDRSLTRNYLAFELAKEMNQQFVPSSNPVDVFLNGEYYGVYGIGEQVEVDEGRVELVEDPSAADCGFLLEVGGSYGGGGTFAAGIFQNVEIHYPKTTTPEQYNYIANYVAEASNAIMNRTNYEDYIDVDSYIDWLLLTEFTYNWDASYIRNVYMYKDAGGKLKFGPMWDFDLSMGSVGYDDPTYQSWATSMNGLVGNNWTTSLLQDPAFMERMKARWLEKKDSLNGCVERTLGEMQPRLQPSFDENHWRWMADVDGQNIAWEWILEYEDCRLPHLFDYMRSVFAYRNQFLDRCLIDGYVCPPKPLKEEKDPYESEGEHP